MRVTLTLTLETPFLPGSADPNRVDLDWPLRPSEVKGIWRWWARAFVAGVLFEMGYLCDCKENRMLKKQARSISLIVGKGLGLGYADQETSQASEFEIFIEPIGDPKISKLDSYLHYCKKEMNHLQRINLLMISKTIYNIKKDRDKIKIIFSNNIRDNEIEISRGVLLIKNADEVRDGDFVIMETNGLCEKLRVRISETNCAFICINNKYRSKKGKKVKIIKVYKELEYIDPSSNFTINLRVTYRHRSKNEGEEDVKNKIIASLGILLTALTLSCFGKGGRKGLGCFSIGDLKVEGTRDDIANINDVANILNDIKGRLNSDEPLSAIENVRSYVKKIVEKYVKGSPCANMQTKLPPIPAVIPNRDVSADNNKAPLFKVMIAEGNNKDALLELLHNFFLKNKRQEMLKNINEKDELTSDHKAWILGLPKKHYGDERRPSPIFVAIHGNKAYITVFTSCDWPWEINNKTIDDNTIIEAISTAIDELEKYLKADKNANITIK